MSKYFSVFPAALLFVIGGAHASSEISLEELYSWETKYVKAASFSEQHVISSFLKKLKEYNPTELSDAVKLIPNKEYSTFIVGSQSMQSTIIDNEYMDEPLVLETCFLRRQAEKTRYIISRYKKSPVIAFSGNTSATIADWEFEMLD